MHDGSADASGSVVADEWERSGPIRLNGWLERQGFSPLVTAFFGLILAFILFQVVISPIATVLLLVASGVSPDQMLGDLPTLIEEHAASLLTANTIGQILGLALLSYLLARLHSDRPWAFIRMRRADAVFIVLGVAGLIAATPAIQWLGTVNEQLPLPDFIRGFEESQMELIERVLEVDTGLLFNLVVLAITPAICEELLFRGYVQRQAERGIGSARGILFSGIIFGLYHLRLTQALPLCVLGVYLAWLVWRTGSLWPAIVVHFTNNAIAIAIGAYISQRPDLDMADLERMDIPWLVLLLGLALFAVTIVGMQRAARQLLAGAPVEGSTNRTD